METFQVLVCDSRENAWYADCVGDIFTVRKEKLRFTGHQFQHTFYSVVGGEFDGELIMPVDCLPVSENAPIYS